MNSRLYLTTVLQRLFILMVKHISLEQYLYRYLTTIITDSERMEGYYLTTTKMKLVTLLTAHCLQ
nr:MAG TPA: hypothetical protein [Caudoviricetes sp.]